MQRHTASSLIGKFMKNAF